MKKIAGVPEVKPSYATHVSFPEFVAVMTQPSDTFASLAETYLKDRTKGWIISEFNGIDEIAPGQELIVPLKTLRRGGVMSNGYQTVPVLTYHRFSKHERDATTVREKDFEDQMKYLKTHGYSVITVDALFDFLDGVGRVPEKSVVITIDDGWNSVYEIAYPILKKHGFPATLFLYTDLVNQSSETLDWKVIGKMAENGVDIQCHSRTHRNLTVRMEKESPLEYFRSLKSEMTESAEIIEAKTGKKVSYFAYPYGDANPLAAALLEKTGYKGAFTVERKSNPFFIDRFHLGRRMIYGGFDLDAFEKNLRVFDDEALR